MSEKYYTFKVFCTFEMQYTFTESEVERDADGGEYAVEPTDAAIEALEAEVLEYVSQNYPVESVEVSTDSDLIMHDPRNPDIG